ncbi:MAG: hypothetical protein RMJ56_08840 [Gemmataceae bacterium]|nr:hypothetical protein [Gemmata sp.]MDW8197692.1 hypothetical protein [Gemmataceae bacterium]
MFFRPNWFRNGWTALAAMSVVVSFASTARADLISFSGSGGRSSTPVSFSGTMEYTPLSTTSATLTITLKNTTSFGNAVQFGYITGFGFNLPTGVTASNTTSGSPFFFLNATDHATNLQGGEFDYAFSLSSSQLHTVNSADISKGLAAGQSATFTVALSGTGLHLLSAQQIIQELSNGTGSQQVPFSVRFRSTNTNRYKGLSSPDGDKVPVDLGCVTVIPAPPGALLASFGIGGVLLGRWWRRRAALRV